MNKTAIWLAAVLALVVSGAGFLGFKYYEENTAREALQKEIAALKDEFASTTSALNLELEETEGERDSFERKFEAEKARVDFLALQIESVQGAVGLLEKLTSTDAELLQKYSKIYFLNEHYAPDKLAKIPDEFAHEPAREKLFHAGALPHLSALMQAAREGGVDLLIISAYRSFGEQSGLKEYYKVVYGSGANQFSADQGYSEHQLGTAVDFTTKSTTGNFPAFKNTPAYEWLAANAHKYGFVLSYPEGNTYYLFEPWHWRFVGRELASQLYENGQNFYDLPERELNRYLLTFFD